MVKGTAPPNKGMELTVLSVTCLARGKSKARAALRPAAHPQR